MACFEDQILEYATGNLSEQEADRVRGHIKYCPKCHSYYLGLLKIEADLIAWNVRDSFGDDFDKELIVACEERLEAKEFIHDILKPLLKYFYLALGILAFCALYRYTLFNETAAVFSRIGSSRISLETEAKDLELYLEQRLIGELGEENPNLCTLATLEMALNLPSGEPAEQRIADLKYLLNETADAARKRFFLFNALDGAFLAAEDMFKPKAAAVPAGKPGKQFLLAAEALENKEWDKAAELFKAVTINPSSAEEAKSATFRLAFVLDITGDYAGADRLYALLPDKYQGSVEGLLAPEMRKFAQARRRYSELVEIEAARIKKRKENAATYYIIGNERMLHFDLDAAADAYTRVILKFYGKNKRHSKINLAWCFMMKGDYKSAIDLYGSFKRIDLDHRIYGDFGKSLAYARLGDTDRARESISWEASREFPGAYKTFAENYLAP